MIASGPSAGNVAAAFPVERAGPSAIGSGQRRRAGTLLPERCILSCERDARRQLLDHGVSEIGIEVSSRFLYKAGVLIDAMVPAEGLV